MMMITSAQMSALQLAMHEQFLREIERFLDEYCDFSKPHDGSAPLDHSERRPVMRELVERARTHGIFGLRSTVQFVMLGLGYSRFFDEIPRVKEMLREPGRTPGQNIQAVLNAVVVAEARAAK